MFYLVAFIYVDLILLKDKFIQISCRYSCGCLQLGIMESNGKNKKPEEKVGPIESTDETKVSKDGDCKGQTDDSEKFESGSQQGAENEEEIEEVYSERVKEVSLLTYVHHFINTII